MLALGKAGRPGCGYGCLTGQGNGQGGREHGQKADQLPGYRRIDDPAARAHVAGVWGVEPDDLPGPGRSAYELLDSLGTDGGVRALLVMGSNVAVSAPHAGHVEERLDALDFLVVCDSFLSETAERADVVLPVAQWAEEDGTMTNLEGRVILRRRAPSTRRDGVRSDLEVLAGLAARLGCARRLPVRSARRCSTSCGARAPAVAPTTAGISYARIARDGGIVLAMPGRGQAGHAAALPRALRHRGRPRALPRRQLPPRTPSRRTTSTRCASPPAASCATTSRARRPGGSRR